MHGTRETQKVKKGKGRGFIEGNLPTENDRKGHKGAPRRYYETEIDDDDSDSGSEEE